MDARQHSNHGELNERNHVRPYPYFVTTLQKIKGHVLDCCISEDLLHMFPEILALAAVLFMIATKQPFRPESLHYFWDETTINNYYE